jgi:hypothetical protein
MVDKVGPNLTAPNVLRNLLAPMRLLCRSLCLLFFAGLLVGTVPAAEVPGAHAGSPGPNLSFSVADFDGDSRPDLASVQYGTSDSSRAAYLIQLQLSAAGQQSFQIVAPVGGLQIVARDVNGDHALDLVLTSAWLRQPVAILLNDGHGNFSRVEPEVYPEAFRESDTDWNCSTQHEIDGVAVPPQSRDDISSRTEPFLQIPVHSRLTHITNPQFVVGPFLISNQGRAPPSEVSHS